LFFFLRYYRKHHITFCPSLISFPFFLPPSVICLLNGKAPNRRFGVPFSHLNSVPLDERFFSFNVGVLSSSLCPQLRGRDVVPPICWFFFVSFSLVIATFQGTMLTDSVLGFVASPHFVHEYTLSFHVLSRGVQEGQFCLGSFWMDPLNSRRRVLSFRSPFFPNAH